MGNKSILNRVKAFGLTNQLITEDIQKIGATHGVELGHVPLGEPVVDSVYYPQFDAVIRAEAAAMGKHYEAFYCLETSIRALVSKTLETAESSADWWKSSRVNQAIKNEVAGRIQKELDAGVTPRSSQELDYTTFGELSVIITSNWDVFGSLFSSRKAVEKVMASLNSLRVPITHCSPLAEDEVLRLQLTVRDWFRLME